MSLIESKLKSMSGILEISVSHNASRASVVYEPWRIGPRDITEIITGLGYEVKLENSHHPTDRFSYKSEISK